MTTIDDRLSARLRRSEQRSQTALGVAMLVVALVVVAAILVAVSLLDNSIATHGGSMPAPATVVLLLTGFVLFLLARRRV